MAGRTGVGHGGRDDCSELCDVCDVEISWPLAAVPTTPPSPGRRAGCDPFHVLERRVASASGRQPAILLRLALRVHAMGRLPAAVNRTYGALRRRKLCGT